MSSNSSSSQLKDWMLAGAYFGEGLLIGIPNLLVAVALIRYEALRSCNRFKFIIGQSIADFINLLAYAFAGLYRLLLLWRGTNGQKIPLWDCALQPARLLWGIWGDRLVALMSLLVAFDRFLSVLLPLEYIGWGSVYPIGAISGSYAFVTACGLLGLYLEWGVADKLVSNRCTSAVVRAAGDAYGWYYQTTAQIYSILTFPVYGAVVVLYRRQMNSMVHQLDSVQAEQLAQQRRFTKSLMINCLMNLFLWVIPFTVGHMSRRYGWGGASFGSLSFVVGNIYPLCDIAIFSARHAEVRQAIAGLFTCKSMPADLWQWVVNANAKSQAASNIAFSNRAPTAGQHEKQEKENQNDLELQDL